MKMDLFKYGFLLLSGHIVMKNKIFIFETDKFSHKSNP